VKPVALHTERLIAPRNGEEFRDTWHIAVEGRVKARDLWEVGIALHQGLNQANGGRQMLRIKRDKAAQLCEHLYRDTLRGAVAHPTMHNTVANGTERGQTSAVFEPFQQQWHTRGMVRSLDIVTFLMLARALSHRQDRMRQTDTFDAA